VCALGSGGHLSGVGWHDGSGVALLPGRCARWHREGDLGGSMLSIQGSKGAMEGLIRRRAPVPCVLGAHRQVHVRVRVRVY
jgi:hypothetical protein